ncbi:MAG: GNAT family N-acetyltransferase, partial [Caulobacteraceae bacterium]
MPRALDLTPALTDALALVRHAAREGEPLRRFLAERIGQGELFEGGAISPATEAFLRLFHSDEAMTRLAAADKVAFALKDYARRASAVEAGADLLGAEADENTARAILKNAAAKIAAGDAGAIDTVRAPGRSGRGAGDAKASDSARPVVVDLRGAGEPGAERAERGGEPQEDRRGAEGGRPGERGDEERFELTVQQVGGRDGATRFDFLPEDKALIEKGWQADEVVGIGGYVEDDGKTWRIRGSGLPSSARGRGLGVSMYEALVRKAFAEGATEVRSDNEVSGDARRVYEALQRRGYTVELAPELTEFENKTGAAAWHAPGAEPVYRVTGLPQISKEGRPEKATGSTRPRGPSGEALVRSDPELRALADDTERLAAENGIEVEAEPN